MQVVLDGLIGCVPLNSLELVSVHPIDSTLTYVGMALSAW